jgi:hypothetical protein
MTDPQDDAQGNIQIVSAQEGQVSSDLYEDLLNRYERALIFAGQLQEKNRQQLLLQEKNDGLEQQVESLKRQVSVEESYTRLLEGALKSLGVLK